MDLILTFATMDAEAKKILDRRLAMGEISPEEYRTILDELQPAGEGSRSDVPLGRNEEEPRASPQTPSSTIQPAPAQEQKSSSGCGWVFLFLIIGGVIFAVVSSQTSSDDYNNDIDDSYERTPLSDSEIEAAARSVYIEVRYTFKRFKQAIEEGDTFDQEKYQNELVTELMEAVEKYPEVNQSTIRDRVMQIGTFEDDQ